MSEPTLVSSSLMSKHFVKFRPDNFTPSARTPWGGSYIVESLKAGIDFERPGHGVGESWEFSLDEKLPSRLSDSGESFESFLNREADAWISKAHLAIWAKHSPLLVKYIDAKDDLSLQLHPPIEDPVLEAGLSGKWEAWHVINAKEGAGIYLGFKPGLQLAEFEAAIRLGADIKAFLQFIPVAIGETYVIAPCTPHALGAGVCVIEPQIMRPGKETLTLRLYDWDRRYDLDGRLCEHGQKRLLHVDAAFRYLKESLISGACLEAAMHPSSLCIYKSQSLRVDRYVYTPYLEFFIVEGTGVYSLNAQGELGAISVILGTCEFTSEDSTLGLNAGESGAVSASAKAIVLTCQTAKVFLAFGMPEAYCSSVGLCD